jgi:hypothetical protein
MDRAPLAAGLTLLLLGVGQTATAGPIVFDFNTLSTGQNNAAVRHAMQATWSAAGMPGHLKVSGARAEKTYDGEGHVVGPVVGGTVVPLTLGSTEGGVYENGALDSFVVNSGSDRITVKFPVPVYRVSFDYEIFPNGQVPDGTKVDPALYPDFTFRADGQQVLHTLSVLPGQGGTYPYAPLHGTSTPEVAPQFLGTSGTLTFANGVKKLEFVDWPVMVGIDNLTVDTAPPLANPEPAGFVLFGAGAAGLMLARRFRKGRT